MNDGLDIALLLPEVGEKPSKPYRSSPYTVREYCALPYAQRVAVDAACDAAAGLTRTDYADDTSPQPYTVGRASRHPTPAVLKSEHCPSTATLLPPPTLMPLSTVHPAPSPALHTLNTPELIHHDAAHPDSLATSAVLTTVLDTDSDTDAAHGDHALTFDAMTAALGEAARPPAPAAPVAHDGTVYETTDYDLFRLLDQNRVVNQQHVRRLVEKIKQVNLLRECPISVSPDMEVLDGQHRLRAARELGLPIYYKIGRQLSAEHIAVINSVQMKWTGTDYLHHFAVLGKPDYVALAEFMQRHPLLNFSNAKMLLAGVRDGAGKADLFWDGLWQVGSESEKAEEAASLIDSIANLKKQTGFGQSTHTRFVAAITHCVLRVPGFQAAEFLRKLLQSPRSLVPCATHKQYMELFSEIYNRNTKHAENRVRFD